MDSPASTSKRTEAASFEGLVRGEMPRLLGLARRLLQDEAQARGAAREAFLQGSEAFDSLEDRPRLSARLRQIAVRACVRRLRGNRRATAGSLAELLPTFLDDGHHTRHPREWRAAETLLGDPEARDFVRARIDSLPGDHRAVLVLCDVEELSVSETAQAFGLPESRVKALLHEARQALRGLLEPRFQKGEP